MEVLIYWLNITSNKSLPKGNFTLVLRNIWMNILYYFQHNFFWSFKWFLLQPFCLKLCVREGL